MIFEQIKEGIKQGLSDDDIIQSLEGKKSTIERLIIETRKLIEPSYKQQPIEDGCHLQKYQNGYIDLNNGDIYEVYNKPYDKCQHGLCKKLKTIVLKRIIESNTSPNVFKRINVAERCTPITVTFKTKDKSNMKYVFDSFQLSEYFKNEDLPDKILATKLSCNRECIENLRRKMDAREIRNKSKNKKIQRATRPRGITKERICKC